MKSFDYEYDPEKNELNKDKHGVNLADAEMVFYDDRALRDLEDKDHDEQRWVAVGLDAAGRLLTVLFTYRDPDIIRAISARKATAKERRSYARGKR
ncbi:hypothetical protein SAMN04490179_5086 [Pseudomonas antarctica]|uniref:BrnT family toxin n=1 Tax=Pseudomonas antarctica TaxID=219572 RepID=A0A1H0CVK9_9PSED|nr:BrnT family toxin [Pseudomonas antarctica]KAF2406177.1 hypothetical protein PSAN_54020 [Pseudomonas antarctica]SDN61711.1 hypothetical protein SAMN04490179_5086 [Pseudomonas antarctica]